MRNEQDKEFELSYESDGEMGGKTKSPSNSKRNNKEERQQEMFFNTTQDSE
ncbi:MULTISPECIES: hypothetical protein [unclassified Cytobacillus]|uniref:hypothetical protein n=1 Tax=unclassified Cytobacillus TaxID=2675268 RepID=UPI0013FA4AC0|nr:hypothetical protein [Cytobacillus sp. AMY 15.2]KAF0817464.1 hypothetical protein KIS4809_3728 [Bacillus sp. ZZV12-4809]MCM3091724.1 hypothetical protein [Cytobacillus sp. AMY 15.2]